MNSEQEIRAKALELSMEFTGVIVNAAIAAKRNVKWDFNTMMDEADKISKYISTGEKS